MFTLTLVGLRYAGMLLLRTGLHFLRTDIAYMRTAPCKLHTDPDTLVMLAYGKASLDQAIQDGTLVLSGSKTVLEGFLGLFKLPGPIPK